MYKVNMQNEQLQILQADIVFLTLHIPSNRFRLSYFLWSYQQLQTVHVGAKWF